MLAEWGAREPLAVVIATFLLSLSRSGEPQTSCEGLSSDLSILESPCLSDIGTSIAANPKV